MVIEEYTSQNTKKLTKNVKPIIKFFVITAYILLIFWISNEYWLVFVASPLIAFLSFMTMFLLGMSVNSLYT